MPLDGITMSLLAGELNDELKDTRIDKIYQPDKNTFYFHIRTPLGIKKLLISIDPSSPRICLTEQIRENPVRPPSFCMLLRKYLSGAKISSISSPEFERLIEIRISYVDELHDMKSLTLIAELMGRKSNLILVNQSGKIIDSSTHVDFQISRVREIMPGRIYEYPPSQNKLNPDKALSLLSNGKLPIIQEEAKRPIGKALLNSLLGTSPLLIRSHLNEANIDERESLSEISSSKIDILICALKDTYVSITTKNYSPHVFYENNKNPIDYSPFKLTGFNEYKETASISSAIDLFYSLKLANIDLELKKTRLLTIINNALSTTERKKELHLKDIEEGKKSDYYKLLGDLIIGNMHLIKQGASSIYCPNYYEDPVVDVLVPLNPVLDAASNSQDYYKRFRKAKKKLELATKYYEDDMLSEEYLRTLKAHAMSISTDEDVIAIEDELSRIISTKQKDTPKDNTDINKTVGLAKSGKASSRAIREAAKKAKSNSKSKKPKKEKALSYRRYISPDGYEILCGRNNIQNDELTFRIADKNDLWFHIKGMPGTHVILKSKNCEPMPSDEAVLMAANIAAFYSKRMLIEEHQGQASSKWGEIKVEVDYCKVSHVKKIPGAKPGMVIYEGYYSIIVSATEPQSYDDSM